MLASKALIALCTEGCLLPSKVQTQRRRLHDVVYDWVQAYGYELPKDIEYLYTHVRKTHNTGVFDAYTDEMKRARKSGILTGQLCAQHRVMLGSGAMYITQ